MRENLKSDLSFPRLNTYSRRDALKLGIASVAGLGLAGCTLSERDESERPEMSLSSGIRPDSDEWMSVRSHFNLLPGVSYLNNSSIGVPPGVVIDAVASGYRLMSEDPIHGKHYLQDQIVESVLPSLGRFFNASTEEITLTRNASVALHLQAVGLELADGDEVVITTQEHPAGRKPWSFRAGRHGINIKEVFIPSPLPPDDDILQLFDQVVTPNTKAIAFCHVTRGGHLYPVKRLCEFAKSRNIISLVDGAQAVGQFKVDLHDLGCDAYSASLHKWILAPAGTGMLYLKKASSNRFLSSFEPESNSLLYGVPGTADFPIRASISSAIDFVESLGIENIEKRCRYLSDHLKDRLAGESNVTLLSGAVSQSAPGSTIFEIKGLDAIDAVDILAERASIHIDEHQRDGHNAIRISTHVYNNIEEIEASVELLLSVRSK
ncbi:MAG: aminotransferase class V-fold PLP-dependent enzyme [Bacteroidetes Order II. Incertae sedis bacterium]|jgi:isopenicillin-N epimerase|nr:aminotransferase class V-fold PLP-dependent enzyme [Bacteroidetes Order II. bacterium]MBT4052914.1 aminotransferase class V-fold PLP-dependent enzyme [Bacteroidetes Order II. bacterium]MBT5250047.1 aminotransferase class V-fold PLP-dependent enzyme [Bacteroidetes Order II. bacterium]MBT6423612.1 aminotransferase class V-fold PLP-dependent enzyme [Bacteroidetes Order II. bacterium]MBT6581545.1 aminotransferase class V-fold PLP-dependent enzyme [Bacteroidetes Order II. bacterium]